jgi:hypothetical protein
LPGNLLLLRNARKKISDKAAQIDLQKIWTTHDKIQAKRPSKVEIRTCEEVAWIWGNEQTIFSENYPIMDCRY